jgi:hypothetical protein
VEETSEQARLCRLHGVPLVPSLPGQRVGIAKNVLEGLQPLNGLRHPPSGESTGWYIWAGEVLCSADDFFTPLHVAHLDEWCPEVVRFLGLPPGWRFLVAGALEDVWFDPALLGA